MKKLILTIFVYFISLFIYSSNALALPNNIFGIHITHEADLDKAVELVNSSGGDWGYVTIVIQDNAMDYNKWQEFFDQCREKHLIPLVRLATHPEGDTWVKPSNDLIIQYSNFLDSLNWPVKNRYVIVFNEPNHTKEWGGQTNPREYAQILNHAISVFKQKNSDFFMLNAGMDQAAPNSLTTMDETKFLRDMNFESPLIFDRLDGWVSHSYPNHGFIGKPWETGKASVSGYKWELNYLKSLGKSKELPVFITETGWPHIVNGALKVKGENFYKPEIAAEYLKYAFDNVWLKDKTIVAITPFIINYPQEPFDHFSWMNESGEKYPQFDLIADMPKASGQPEQIERIEMINFFYPPFLPSGISYQGKITLINKGQSIWGEKPFILKALSEPNLDISDLVLPEGVLVKPGDKYAFDFTFKTNDLNGDYEFGWQGLETNKIKIFQVWKLNNEVKSKTLLEEIRDRISAIFTK
jgi:hypothetical protein